MQNIEGFNKEFIKVTIKGTTYIRVTNTLNRLLYNLKEQSIINTTLYKKTEDGFEELVLIDLPVEHINKLSYSNIYKAMNDKEINEFKSSMNILSDKIKENKCIESLDDFMLINVLDNYYISNKVKDINVYSLTNIKVNSLGQINKQSAINPNEIPFVIVDILNKCPFIKNRTFIIAINTFIHIHKEEDKLIIMLGYIDDEDFDNLTLKISQTYILGINDNKYTFLDEKEGEVLLNIDNNYKMSILNEFKNNLEEIKVIN